MNNGIEGFTHLGLSVGATWLLKVKGRFIELFNMMYIIIIIISVI